MAEPGKPIGPELLGDHIRRHHTAPLSAGGDLKSAIRSLEEAMIRETMARCGQNRSRTARELGISRQSLLEKLRRMGWPD